MKRLRLILAAIAFVALPVQAALADYVQDLVAVLEDQGYREVSVERTLLGRTRILAVGKNGTRELILNARTGEVLRDIWIDRGGRSLPSELAAGDQSSDDGGHDHEDNGDGGDDHGDDGGNEGSGSDGGGDDGKDGNDD